MTTPIVTQQIDDLTVAENSPNATFNLSSTFDDPSTTGQIARFEFADNVGGGVTDVLLFDQEGVGAATTVENFLNYVKDGDYDQSIIHRSVPGFIIQGGGFAVTDSQVVELPADDPVVNEFSAERSNLPGTIALAKLGNDPDSGTNQWFFNLGDNSANLDQQNGGFTVFGQVLNAENLAPIEAIANLAIVNGGGALDTVPITDAIEPINTDDLVFLERVTLVTEDELQFSVTQNSNEKLVDATITDGELALDYAPHKSGEAKITLQATNLLGESVEEEFVVKVEKASEAEISEVLTSEVVDIDLLDSPVFRFLDPDTGIHFYAASEEERAELASSQPDYIAEAPVFTALDPLTGNSAAHEVFTLLNQDTGAYFYTTSEAELTSIKENSPNYIQETSTFSAFTEEQPGTIPIYRFFDTDTGTHFYTASAAEKESIEENLPNYNSEDIAFYAFPASE
jgi:cyclophilin family peptidyl-prolyl cis-trans isomerase